MKKIYDGPPVHDYMTKFSVSTAYAILASIVMNFLHQPGNIYSNGLTGLAQILTTLSTKIMGFNVPVSITLYLSNVPLFSIMWKKIGKRFTIFTFITVTLASLFMHIVPQTVITQDPIICATFGEAVSGSGIDFVLKNGVSSEGLDTLSTTIRKKTGRFVGSISVYFNALIVFVAGYLFGWQYMFYSALSIFVNGKVTDAVYTRQKKMQAMIIIKNPDRVVDEVQKKMRHGIAIVHEAGGAYRHDRQTILLTIVARFELLSLEVVMRENDPDAFVSISDSTKILGCLYEEDYR